MASSLPVSGMHRHLSESGIEAIGATAEGDPVPHGRRLRVALVVSGYPTADHPYRGIFNLRASRALTVFVDLTVIYLRAWRPGRPWRRQSEIEGTPVVTVAVPWLPIGGLLGWRAASIVNAIVGPAGGWHAVRPILEWCDLVHSVGAATAGLLSSRWARRAKKHHVTQLVGSDVNIFLPKVKSTFGVAGWEKHLHGVACNSAALQRRFTSLYPGFSMIRTIQRGVDTRVFSPAGPALGPLAASPPVRFLYLGGFLRHPQPEAQAHVKGGRTLLLAWQAAEDRMRDAGASLLLAGNGADSEGVRRWRARLRHPERVHIVGPIEPDDVPGHMRAADTILVPSSEEGLPNACMEASACGRPVLGSAVGGIPEVVVDGETGLLLPPGNVERWRDVLIQFAGEPGRLGEMGLRARRRMEELFDSRLYAPRMLDLYRAALQVSRGERCR